MYGFSAKPTLLFEAAVAKLTEALKQKGFDVLNPGSAAAGNRRREAFAAGTLGHDARAELHLDKLIEHNQYIERHGQDLPEIRN